jgi:hypothetical protein
MNHRRAFDFTQSILKIGQDLHDALNKLDWETASDSLDYIESDVEKLRAYVNERLIELENK